MHKIIQIIVLMSSILLYGQSRIINPDEYLNIDKVDYNSLKGSPKEIYYETINKWPYEHIHEKEYYLLDKKKNLKVNSTWSFDSISKKINLENITLKDKKPSKENRNFDEKGNLISKIKYIEKGIFKGLISEQTVYYYDSSNSLKKITHYKGVVDTLDLGIEQLNARIKISNEYLEYEVNKIAEEYYNDKNQLIKEIMFSNIEKCLTYEYDPDGNLIKTNSYRIHIFCDEYHSDCNETIRNCKELKLHRFNNFEITDNVWSETLNFEYKFDSKGNWIEKKVFNYSYTDNPYVKTIKRRIIYY